MLVVIVVNGVEGMERGRRSRGVGWWANGNEVRLGALSQAVDVGTRRSQALNDRKVPLF